MLGISRSSYYYKSRNNKKDYKLKTMIQEQYEKTPFYGVPRMTVFLQEQEVKVNHKRVARMMQELGLKAVCPKPNLSRPRKEHKKYPYLLKGIVLKRPDQVWSTDITYIRLNKGFAYLVSILDWYSRFVLSWKISITQDQGFCLEALDEALQLSTPIIFNMDQGSQFTSDSFLQRLKDKDIHISMNSKGRAMDNIFMERLWRSVKWEEIYFNDILNMSELRERLKWYFRFYNYERPHQSLNYKKPYEVYFKDQVIITGQPTEATLKFPNFCLD